MCPSLLSISTNLSAEGSRDETGGRVVESETVFKAAVAEVEEEEGEEEEAMEDTTAPPSSGFKLFASETSEQRREGGERGGKNVRDVCEMRSQCANQSKQ